MRLVAFAILSAAAVLLAISAALVNWYDPPRWVLFLGSFHRLIIHFPIAILLLAGLLEVVRAFPRFRKLHLDPLPVLFVGAAAAVAAAAAGLLLSLDAAFEGDLLFWHRWLGIGVAAGAVAACVLKALSSGKPAYRRVYTGVLVVTLGLLLAAGHFGGQMAHGPDYLTRHMPGFLRTLLALDSGPGDRDFPDIRRAVIYRDLIQPALSQRCVECHNSLQKKGGLNLESLEGLLAGGESGPVVTPKLATESELYRRITLPLYDEDHMPPDGRRPLAVEQTELIRWWIDLGASHDLTVDRAADIPPSVQTVLNRLSAPESERRAGIFLLDIPPADPARIEQLNAAGILVTPLAQGEVFLEVRCSLLGRGFRDDDLLKLRPLAPQIAWLNVAGTDITDRGLEAVGQMKHLVRLHLENTSVTDSGLKALSDLPYLEYLNLYGTEVTDAGMEHLAALPNLRSLYLWQTQVSAQAVESLQRESPILRVDQGTEGLNRPNRLNRP